MGPKIGMFFMDAPFEFRNSKKILQKASVHFWKCILDMLGSHKILQKSEEISFWHNFVEIRISNFKKRRSSYFAKNWTHLSTRKFSTVKDALLPTLAQIWRNALSTIFFSPFSLVLSSTPLLLIHTIYKKTII